MSIYLLATLDTKGDEARFVAESLQRWGHSVTLVDTGCLGDAGCKPDVSREQVFAAAGQSLDEVRSRGDRGEAITLASQGVATLVRDAWKNGQVTGVLALGGSAGTTIGTAAMRALPLGIPKLMVSTLASGQVRPYVGDKDIFMLNSVVDIAGINRVSRQVLHNAAAALAGMLDHPLQTDPSTDKPLVAATMFGVTTPCVQHAREILEQAGYEVLVFHATGNGGQAMESLIADGMIQGVLDLTTTELADELVGGILSAGKDRLTAAGRRGVPQVISVGATDMVNFGPPESVPDAFQDRQFYHHNPTVTLMRTTAEECAALGREIGEKAAEAAGPCKILFPTQGVSAIDQTGQPFDQPDARRRLLEALRSACGEVPLIELDAHINDPAFAEAAARELLALIDTSA